MPEISRFLGIIIRMYYVDHPPKHFHAHYKEFVGLISIESCEMIEGNLPKRALKLVLEWASIHKEELLSNWELAEKRKPLNKIEPLE